MSENTHPIQELLDASLKNIRNFVDVDTVIGKPITLPDGTTILPISKASFGFASGGSDLPTKKVKDLFGGGSGGGVTIEPVGFLVISGGDIRLLQISEANNNAGRVLNMVPEVIDRVPKMVDQVAAVLKKNKAAKDKPEEEKDLTAEEIQKLAETQE